MSKRMDQVEQLEAIFREKGEFYRREDGTLEFPAISVPWAEYRELAAAAEERDEARAVALEVIDAWENQRITTLLKIRDRYPWLKEEDWRRGV